MKLIFDYESKPFGVGTVRKLPWYIPAMKLQYTLDALEGVSGKILEVGCGGGAMAKAVKYYRPDLTVWGCDISRSSLAQASKNPDGVRLVLGDVLDLPFKDNSLAAVFAIDVFEHLTDLPRALAEVRRVLKPDGIFHLSVPYEGSLLNLEGWLTRYGGWKAKKIYCGHVQEFSPVKAEKVFGGKGLELIGRRFSDYLILQLADIAYFSFISLRGKNFPYQVEGYVSMGRGFWRNLVYFLKCLLATITYFESRLFSWWPGLSGHLTYKKTKR